MRCFIAERAIDEIGTDMSCLIFWPSVLWPQRSTRAASIRAVPALPIAQSTASSISRFSNACSSRAEHCCACLSLVITQFQQRILTCARSRVTGFEMLRHNAGMWQKRIQIGQRSVRPPIAQAPAATALRTRVECEKCLDPERAAETS